MTDLMPRETFPVQPLVIAFEAPEDDHAFVQARALHELASVDYHDAIVRLMEANKWSRGEPCYEALAERTLAVLGLGQTAIRLVEARSAHHEEILRRIAARATEAQY